MQRAVLVTGASSGIGMATVLHLARLGFRAIGSVRSGEKAHRLAEAAKEAGVDVETLVFNVTDAEACERLVPDLGLYGLVNNAGYYNVGTVEDVSAEDALRQLHAMVVAPMRLASLVLPGMRELGQGRIVNVSSLTAHLTSALTGWYQAAKHALSAVNDALRVEAAWYGVDVVVVEPGAIRTEIWRKAEDDLVRRRTGSLYSNAYDRALGTLRRLEGRAHDPSMVAEVIGKALTAGRPSARYRVGPEARLLEWANAVVPAPVKDRILGAALGLRDGG
jgi:short-subunit dehydrogenase